MERKRVTGRDENKRPGAVRLTFSYDGDSLRLIKQQSLEMIAPPSDTLEAQKEASGFWVEVSDKKRNVIYRRAAANPIRRFAEVRSNDPDRPLVMQEVQNPSGIFTILIPDLGEAAEVALFSSPFTREKGLLPATEIARFDLAFDLGGRREKDDIP